MTYNINLSGNSLCGIDMSTIVLPEEKLTFSFSSSIYCINTLHVSARNGEREIVKKLVKPFDIDLSELLFPGIIECEVSLLCGSEVVKTWMVQDLLVKEVLHKYEVVPEIEAIRGAVKEISEILKKNNLI